MTDRLVRATFTGVVLAPWLMLNDLVWYRILHFARSTWIDGMAYLMLGHAAKGFPDRLAGVLGQFVLAGMGGALFSRVVMPRPGEGHYVLRGGMLGVLIWWSTLIVTAIYRVPSIGVIRWTTVFSTFFAALTWGLLFGWLFRRWDVKAQPRDEC